MDTIFLLLLAIAPPAALMYLIYWMDRHEPESLKNVILAMVMGAMSIIPAIIIQVSFEAVPIFTLSGLAGRFSESFLLVAPSEELAKFFSVYLFIRKKPFYNNINDGIVYYGAGALGFALLENIFYVFDYGFSTGMLRAFTSIPLHAFCGIIIGYHAGLARFSYQLKPKRL
ncbi:MAG: PrsW family intramembrane metalloprotease, partial [Firmicutes bacterium HGW-Firmicutes-12]